MYAKNPRREIIKKGLVSLAGIALPRTGPLPRLSAESQEVEESGRENEVVYFWSGGLTSTSIKINIRLKRAGSAQIIYLDQYNFQAYSDSVTLDESYSPDLTHTFELENLIPKVRYRYWVLIDGVTLGVEGRFETPGDGPYSFKIALGNCSYTGSESEVYDEIRAQKPLMFFHLGDFHYENIGENDPQRFRDAYKRVLTSKTQAKLYHEVPVMYMWDDHDFGGDNVDGSSKSTSAAQSMYRYCVPHYPLEKDAGAIYHAFNIGRVRFIVTDGRSSRVIPGTSDDQAGTLLGRTQIEWLKKQFLESEEENVLTVWVNNVSWISSSDPDTWAGFAAERREIANFIEANKIDNLVMLAGDAHLLAIDDGENNRYGDNGTKLFPVFHAGPLDSDPTMRGGPYKWMAPLTNNNFGTMEVIDRGVTVEVVWRGYHLEKNVIIGENVYQVVEKISSKHSFLVPDKLGSEELYSQFLPFIGSK